MKLEEFETPPKDKLNHPHFYKNGKYYKIQEALQENDKFVFSSDGDESIIRLCNNLTYMVLYSIDVCEKTSQRLSKIEEQIPQKKEESTVQPTETHKETEKTPESSDICKTISEDCMHTRKMLAGFIRILIPKEDADSIILGKPEHEAVIAADYYHP